MLFTRLRPRPLPARTVVITGGTSGIGLATALLFARRGWRVGLIARGAAGLDGAEALLIAEGARVHGEVADVADAAALEGAAGRIAERLGPVAVWVNAAGNGVFGRLEQIAPAEFDRVTATTYTGTVNGTRVAQALLARGGGAIVNVCSATAFQGLPGLAAYVGAKAAVRGFSEAVQAELRLARSKIRLVVVYPPAVNTPFFAHAVSYLPLPPRPARPVYQPEVIAAGIYLAATTRRSRMLVSFVAILFEAGSRFAPGLVRQAILRLGYAGQMTDLPAAMAGRDPSLFTPARNPPAVRGPFPARGVSLHLWLARRLGGLGPGVLGLGALLLAVGVRRSLRRLPHAPD